MCENKVFLSGILKKKTLLFGILVFSIEKLSIFFQKRSLQN